MYKSWNLVCIEMDWRSDLIREIKILSYIKYYLAGSLEQLVFNSCMAQIALFASNRIIIIIWMQSTQLVGQENLWLVEFGGPKSASKVMIICLRWMDVHQVLGCFFHLKLEKLNVIMSSKNVGNWI